MKVIRSPDDYSVTITWTEMLSFETHRLSDAPQDEDFYCNRIHLDIVLRSDASNHVSKDAIEGIQAAPIGNRMSRSGGAPT
jgi:hypothetical protein